MSETKNKGIVDELLSVLEEGSGRNMDRAFALHVLGWYLSADGNTAYSPVGSANANDGKHADHWLEYYSTSLAAIAPAMFDTDRFVSAKLMKTAHGGYFAKVTSLLGSVKQFSAGSKTWN